MDNIGQFIVGIIWDFVQTLDSWLLDFSILEEIVLFITRAGRFKTSLDTRGQEEKEIGNSIYNIIKKS
jgi:hypothetical protein